MPVETIKPLRDWEPPGRGELNCALRPAAAIPPADFLPLRSRWISPRFSLSRFVTALLAKFHCWLNARQNAAIARCAEAFLTPCPARAPQATPWRKR
jgi:hypothetical protein